MAMGATARWIGLREWEQSETAWQKSVITLTIQEVKKCAMRIERDSKLLVPVDTGKLKGSIGTSLTTGVNNITAEVGTDVAYSETIEFGSFTHRAQPYLIPSFDRNTGELEKSIESILRR